MQKLLKGFLVAAGVILALAAVVFLAINLYIQSAGTQKRIEDALGKAMKVQVHITGTIVTPWGGLKASGITVEQVPPTAGNFLEAASFTAHFRWIALLQHRLDAKSITLESPRVTWFQSPDGRWALPRATPAPQASPTPALTVGKVRRPAGPPWEIAVHRLAVKEASFDFWNEKGMRSLQFAGVEFDCLEPRAADTHGHASSKNVSLHDKLFFRDMQTGWSYQGGLVKLSSFQTGIGGGEIRGDAQVATQARHSPFTVDASFENVDVNQLMIGAGQPKDEVSGILKGWIDLYGNTGKHSSINGSGHLELAGGQMQNFELFQLLGQGLQIPDLVELNLKTAEVDVRVVNGVMNVDRIYLQSQNLELTAHGTVGIDGKLALDARLTVNGAISSRLPDIILTYFKPGSAPDSRYIDFSIGNTLSHPKTNLLENILGHKIQNQMTDLLKTIFGNKHLKETVEPGGSPP